MAERKSKKLAAKQPAEKTIASTKKSTDSKKEKAVYDEYFLSIFENSEFGLVIFTPDAKVLDVNKALLKLTGYTKKEFIELPIFKLTHPDDKNKSKRLYKELFDGKRKGFKIDKRYVSKSGNIIHVYVTISIVKKSKSKIQKLIAIVENKSDQKAITKKLANEEVLLNALLNGIPDSIYFKDKESRFIKANNAIAQKHGFNSPEDLIGKNDFELFGPEHAQDAYNDEQKIITTGIPIINKEEKEDWTDGRTTWASTTKLPLNDKDGNIIGTFGITRNITEKILAEERIKENEYLYRSLFQNSNNGMFLLTDVIFDCNQAACDILQYDKDFFIGISPAEFSPDFQPDGRSSFESANEKITNALNGIPQHFSWVHKRKDGQLIDTEVWLMHISIGGKKLVQAILQDITEQKKNEKAREVLFEISEAAYTASDIYQLYSNIHEIIGKLLSVKNFYIALYNEAEGTISFPYWVDEFDPPMAPKKLGKGLTEYVLRTGKPALIDPEKDLELRRLGEVELIGSPQAIWLGVPLKLADKTIGVIVVQDYENENEFGEEEVQLLTFVSEQIAQAIERKRSSDEIKKIADELTILNNTKDKFFSIIAHDLRNPFITILGFTDLLLTDYKELEENEFIFYLEEMKKSAEISHNLLQNLLQWSRSQTGRIEYHPLSLPLKSIVNANLELLKPSAASKEIQILSEVPESIQIFADEDMLNTVIRNLITNSIKFTNQGGRIFVNAKVVGRYAEVNVSDNGVGMDSAQVENLFRLDVNHSTLGTNREAGTGLGLILCKEFIEKHGGKIWVESEKGKGTKFIFYLPLAI